MYKINRAILCLSITSGILIILGQILRWNRVDIFTPCLDSLIELGAVPVFLAGILVSGIYFFKHYELKGLMVGLPLLIQIVALLIALFVPFTKIVLTTDFTKLEERQKIIAMIKKGELSPDKRNISQLPPDMRPPAPSSLRPGWPSIPL